MNNITVPFQKLIPSIITVAAMCLGITAIRYSLDGKFNIAVALIIIAAFLDGIDGRIARLLNASSQFGAQLDSLADLCNFGVAPGITIYLWSLKDIPFKGIGWSFVLFFITCSALRLARFNAQALMKKESVNMNYFTGLPMPIAGVLLLIPMVFTFDLLKEKDFLSYWGIAIYVVVIGLLMISKIPIYSAKKLHVSKEKIPFILIIIGLLFSFLILEPWIVLPFVGLLYIIIILSVGLYTTIKSKR
ncbi:MAG: CDP-diacylglycerol--serine O-phosphatidyltransferase [Candidatus Midichloriaceae bacterium]|jgi:CDP-diacylglycerol--serine O-phosphatidyltransferase